MFGFFNIDKPPGPTSHDMVASVRRRLSQQTGRKIKVGHSGTLDPFAGGVLVICAGPATRLADYVQRLPKRYLAQVTLGAVSSTDDSEGEITSAGTDAMPTEEAVRAAANQFVGNIQQIPPAHSAVHVDGKRAYKLARAGVQLELPARDVTMYSIDVTSWSPPLLEIDVRCGSGTYIRALARDIGTALGTGGYCSQLTRTEVGPFDLTTATRPDDPDFCCNMLDPLTALSDLPRVTVTSDEALRVSMGHRFRPASVTEAGTAPASEAAVTDQSGTLLALATIESDGLLRPRKVFISAT